ncbi:MAG: hypothetical protein JXP34_20890 [Planctomycetes bacterium]|nr:hypothetical protein [Planctomycetota bacterium]
MGGNGAARSCIVAVCGLAVALASAAALAQTVWIDLGSPDTYAGLRNTQRGDGTDGENDPGTCGPAGDLRSGRTTRGAADDDVADPYMYFVVTDASVKGSPRFRIRAAFYDDPGFGADPVTVRLEYTNQQSTGALDLANTFSPHPRTWTLSGTGRWVRHAWSIDDAGFRTFMQGTSDFRFDVGRRHVCVSRVEVSVPPLQETPVEPLVGVHYYPWYTRDRWNYGECYAGALRLELVPAEAPALGRYDSSSSSVVDQHIRWCAEYGINVIILEYIAPGGREDNVSRQVVLSHARSNDVQFAVMYDWAIRFGGNFAITPERMATAAADFDHLAREYFPHPTYLKAGGRPVALIYVTRALQGDVDGLIGVLRDACGARGWDIYLAGDEFFFTSSPKADKIARWDGIFGYDCYAGRGGYWGTNGTLDLFRRRTDDYLAAAEAAGVAFIPSILSGFNDRAIRRTCADNPALPRALAAGRAHTSLFEELLVDVALPRLDPDLPLLAVTSFNEWHEDTQIEPTKGGAAATSTDTSPSGTQYVQGFTYEDYGTAFLEVVRDAVIAVSGRVLDPRGTVPGALVEVLRGDEVILERRSFSTGAYTIPRLRLEPSVSYRLRASAGDGEVVSAAFTVLPDRARTGFDLFIPDPPVAVPFRRGDANADGGVDIADAVFILTYIFGEDGEAQVTCEASADVNDDDSIGIADAISALSYLFSSGPIPAPGAVACGTDPTPGEVGCAAHAPCAR